MPTRSRKTLKDVRSQVKRIEKLFKPLYQKAYKSGDTERMEQLRNRYKKAYLKESISTPANYRRYNRWSANRDAEYATNLLVEKSIASSNG